MNKINIFSLTLSLSIALSSFASEVYAQGDKTSTNPKKNHTPVSKAKIQASTKSNAVDSLGRQKQSDYDKLRKEAVVEDGLFTIIRKGADYYYEIPTKLLGRDMLIVNKLQRVPKELNEAGVNRGVNYENKMIRLEWTRGDKQLRVREQRPAPHSTTTDAIARSVGDNYISPLIASFKIEAVKVDTSALIVKVNELYDGSETSFNNVFGNINLGTSAIKSLSRIQDIKSFANNVVARSELTTRVTEGTSSVNVTVEVSSSILLLPERPMSPRLASHRVGYFTTPMLSYSDKQHRVEHRHLITRWRLEPRPEERSAYLAGTLVEPVRPILFYIDPATPQAWRPYIKAGVEEWQRAFERAGFKNAIRAEELPQGADADDVNYSLISYAASEKKNAMGPSLLDPRTGEILEADIMWWHNVVTMLDEWIRVQTATVNPQAQQADLPEELMGDAIRFVACHEVGHSLGLRHNMIASWAFPTDSLRSVNFTGRENTTSASIMDYARFNYIAQPGDGVTKLSPHLGPYDLFAIEYGYRWYDEGTNETEELHKLLERHKGRLYKYSEAQDVRDAVDPRAQNEDLGDDPIRSSLLGIANLKRIVPNIVRWTSTGEPGQSYERASALYYAVVHQWNSYLYHVLANIGGIYIENTSVGDAQDTYTFVPRERQRAALDFLLREVLSYPHWLFDTPMGQKLYLYRHTPQGLQENSPWQVLKNAQAYILWDLLGNNRLMRMIEHEAVVGRRAFTVVELMDALHRHIFASTERGLMPNVQERSLQKNFLDALLTAAAEPEAVKINKKLMDAHPYLCPSDCGKEDSHKLNGSARTLNFYGSQLTRISDAISVKRGELLRVKRLLLTRMSTADVATRYHYEDMVLRINTALGIK